jgi:hypothetical protein
MQVSKLRTTGQQQQATHIQRTVRCPPSFPYQTCPHAATAVFATSCFFNTHDLAPVLCPQASTPPPWGHTRQNTLILLVPSKKSAVTAYQTCPSAATAGRVTSRFSTTITWLPPVAYPPSRTPPGRSHAHPPPPALATPPTHPTTPRPLGCPPPKHTHRTKHSPSQRPVRYQL